MFFFPSTASLLSAKYQKTNSALISVTGKATENWIKPKRADTAVPIWGDTILSPRLNSLVLEQVKLDHYED